MKKTIKMICAVCLAVSLAIPTLAVVFSPTMLMWDNVQRITYGISFSGTKGIVNCTITGVSGVDSISGTAKVYDGKTEVESWDVTGVRVAGISKTFTGKSGVTYRLVLDIVVTKDGVEEPITLEDSATCP